MRRAAKISLGCLFAPIGLLVIGLVAYGGLRAAGVPDVDVGSDTIDQPLADFPRTELTPVPLDTRDASPASIGDGIRVQLDMVEGAFRVEAHDGPDIEVQAEYDQATYALDRSYGLEDGLPVFKLRFYSKIHFLRRLAQNGGLNDNDVAMNEVTVYLPKGVPIDLRVKFSRSESQLILDDITLTNLVTDLSMGEYSVESDTPNPVVMRAAHFKVGMGEFDLTGLAHLRAKFVQVAGRMGEIDIDFGTSLMVDTEMKARMRMGEMTIRIPSDVLFDPDSSFKAFMGEVDNRDARGRRIEDPENARRLKINGSVLMGELVVDEFRSRPWTPSDVR